MRRRFQKPKIRNKNGYWIAQFRDLEGRKRKLSLGPVAQTKKVDAENKLARCLEPINSALTERAPDFQFGAFVRQVYLPFYRRKWKASTAACNEDRIGRYLLREFGECPLGCFSRNQLQTFLDLTANEGFSHSIVAHLRWDLRQILRMAVAEGCLRQNPAELLFVPRNARQFEKPRLTLEQVNLLFSVLALRERVIAGFAILAGMRPGEIFALRRCDIEKGHANIRQGIYRGTIDTPKTLNSIRLASFGDCQAEWLREWLEFLPENKPDAWIFPSEKWTTPLRKDNVWRRDFYPKLKTLDLQWANFQVMRRTHSCLMDDLGVDPQVRADQMGHSVDVNQNRYTRSSLERRKNAVNGLEKAVGIRIK